MQWKAQGWGGTINSVLVILPLPPAPVITSGATQRACLAWLCSVDSTLVSKKLFQLQSYSYWRPARSLSSVAASRGFSSGPTLEHWPRWSLAVRCSPLAWVSADGFHIPQLTCTNHSVLSFRVWVRSDPKGKT